MFEKGHTMISFFKFSLVAASLGGTVIAAFAWHDIDPKTRFLVRGILFMTFVAAIPGFIDAGKYIYAMLPYMPAMQKLFRPITPPAQRSEEAKSIAIVGMVVMSVPLSLFLTEWWEKKVMPGLWHRVIIILFCLVGVVLVYIGATMPPVR